MLSWPTTMILESRRSSGRLKKKSSARRRKLRRGNSLQQKQKRMQFRDGERKLRLLSEQSRRKLKLQLNSRKLPI